MLKTALPWTKATYSWIEPRGDICGLQSPRNQANSNSSQLLLTHTINGSKKKKKEKEIHEFKEKELCIYLSTGNAPGNGVSAVTALWLLVWPMLALLGL